MEWLFAYAWEERILEQSGSLFIRKFASINIRLIVEPTVQPISSIVPPKLNVIW
jgi:hypothetical protein